MILYYYFAQMFHGQVNGQVICFFTRSFDLAWPGVAPPLHMTSIIFVLLSMLCQKNEQKWNYATHFPQVSIWGFLSICFPLINC